jgi:hypothetical protein
MARHMDEQNSARLYQLPPAEFTRERNSLAKEIGGHEGKRIRALPKPSTSAWAVNQLYWRDRDTYDELVAASERLRSAHRSMLGGRKADLVGADAAHRDAVKGALTSTLRLVKDAGQKISTPTHTEIAQTLENLSAEDPPGQLAKPLHPEGFEALRGMPVRAQKAEAVPRPRREPSAPRRVEHAAREERTARARQERERKEAERAQRAARSRERRDRAAVKRLQQRVARAERATAAAKSAYERAQAAESKLKQDLERAEESLHQSERAIEEA